MVPIAWIFVPAERVAYNFSHHPAAALEHYADYGYFSAFYALSRQNQTGFVVVDYNGDPNSVECIGHGFTRSSDALVLKLIITHDF
jgi:hypothetical protein